MNRHFRYVLMLAVLAVLAVRTKFVHAHGTPIHLEKSDEHVEESDERLIVSLGLSDPLGYAPMIIHENDDDGEPFATTNLKGFGQATIWQLPGYEIFGLEENSGLFLEPIARPAAGTDPLHSRVLWYWNPETALVEPADPSVRLQIRKTETLNTTILASSEMPPPPLEIAAPLAAEMNFHNHLVLYALDVAAPDGAYGFFARLTSNLYEPSQPFLIVLNLNIFDYELMTEAALAINQAALLPGDFNRDDHVDAADYTLWRNDGLGPEKYAEWKTHFGQSSGDQSTAGGGAGTGPVAVPEPVPFALIAGGWACGAGVLRHRRRPCDFKLLPSPKSSPVAPFSLTPHL
jgi:hypothetical protein